MSRRNVTQLVISVVLTGGFLALQLVLGLLSLTWFCIEILIIALALPIIAWLYHQMEG